jgi:signal transduction histidine kinase
VNRLEQAAKHSPANFSNRLLLVQAEVARLEGRPLEAMRLYDQAIASAAAGGFGQNEAIASERAAGHCAAQGLGTMADQLLRQARAAYARWGADGKVRQLEADRPELRTQPLAAVTGTFTVGTSQLDLLSVVKASQAISGEIDLDGLLTRLIQVVIAQAGADKGYLVLPRRGSGLGGRRDQLTIEAEAVVREDGAVAVQLLRSLPVSDAALLPVSVVNYVWRTRERVLTTPDRNPMFAADPYVARERPRSILCLPIVRQGELVGLFYLENNLVTGAFASDAIEVLELLAAQAAISLEHALLLAQEKAARVQALEALRLREEFLTVASHELRTPMTSLTLNLQTLQGRATPGQPRPDLGGLEPVVDLACRQALRMNRLVAELLDVSRIQTGRLTLDHVEVDLVPLVRETLKRFAPELDQARCPVTLRGDGSARGWWDPARLERVVENLLSNAIKFGAGRPIEITVVQAPGLVQLQVRDGGIGIDHSQWERIFERFGRAVSEEHYGGLGLGLYICRWIVEAHGGTIAVASTPGSGATFTVELPTVRPAPPI